MNNNDVESLREIINDKDPKFIIKSPIEGKILFEKVVEADNLKI